MADDLLITPGSRKLEIKDTSGNVDAKIETDASGNLLITNAGGDISIGDTSSDVFIGDGTNNVDIVFEQDGEIRGTSGVTLTLGASGSIVAMGTDLSLGGNDLTNVNDITISGNLTVNGTTTTLDSTNTVIEDSIIELNSGLTGANSKDIGFIFERGSTGNNAGFVWDESADRFTVFTTTDTAASDTVDTSSVANFQAGSFFGNGANLTSLNASNISSGFISSDRIATGSSGNWWSGNVVKVGTDGVSEVGKYLDFHNTDAGTSDFDTRLYSNATGQLTINGAGRILTTADEGAGNGLDADTLDSQHGSYYTNASNLGSGTISDDRLPGTISSNITGTAAGLSGTPNITVGTIAASSIDGGSTVEANAMFINTPDGGSSPAITALLRIYGYEGRGAGIKIRDSANSASGASNREWFIGSGYSQSGFNIGYAADGSQSSYAAQNKFSISTAGHAAFAGNITVTGEAAFNGTKLEGDSKEMLRFSDTWLRINPDNDFTSGIYAGTGIFRTDGQFQVGSSGNQFKIESNGNTTVAGTISSGAITTSGTGTAGAPTLDIINSSSSTFNHSIEAMAPNMTAGENNIIIVGRAGSSKNSGYIGYKYSAAGSNANVLTFGHWASDNLVNLTGDGKLGIGTETPSAMLTAISTADATPAIKAQNTGGIDGVIQQWIGDTDSMELRNMDAGDYELMNTQQNNGIVFRDGTGGVEIHYNGNEIVEVGSLGGLVLMSGNLQIPHTMNHKDDSDTYVKFDDNRVRIVNGNNTYLDTNNGSAVLHTSTTFGGDVSGTYGAIVVADDSHNHIISNVDGLQTALDAKMPLAGGTFTGGITSTVAGNAITISSEAPQIRFNDTTSGADDFWIHVNSDRFYILADRGDDGSWETPYPLELNASSNIGYIFSHRAFTEDYHPNADKWTTARTLSLTGAVTGSVSWDGSGNASIATTATADPTLTLSGDASGSATFTNLGNATLSVTIANDSHTHAFNNLTSKTSGTGEYSTSGYLRAGRGSGGVALTHNDGYGNANVTFNHVSGVPEQAGNCGRIVVNTDSTTSATMYFELVSNSGTTALNTPSAMELTETGAYFPQYLYHLADTDTYIRFTDNRVRIFAGGVSKFDSNNTYLTGNQTITLSGDVSGSGTTSITCTVADDSHNHIISNVDGLQTALDAKLPLAGGTMTGAINAGGGINGLTLSNGISGNNFNITGVNQLSINDPGEGILFGANCNLYLLDDANDNILRLDAPGGFRLHNGPLSIGTTTVIDTSRNLTNIGTISSGNIEVGTSDTTNGTLTIHGGATGNSEGGEIRLQTAADHDGTYDFYRLDIINDDFRIGRQGQTDFYIFQDGLVKAETDFQASNNITVGTGSNSPNMIINKSTSGVGSLVFNNAGGTKAKIILDPSEHLRFYTGSTNAVSERLTILEGGNVGINDNNPATTLDVGGTIRCNNEIQFADDTMRIFKSSNTMTFRTNSANRMTLDGNGVLKIGSSAQDLVLPVDLVTGGGELLYDAPGNGSGTDNKFLVGHIRYSGSGSSAMQFVKQNFTGMGGSIEFYCSPALTTLSTTSQAHRMALLGTTGDFAVAGDLIAYSTQTGSDRKLKENIRDLEGSLDKTLKLRGVKYDWKDENKANDQIGFIAQEVQEIVPEVVDENQTLTKEGETHLTVNYPALVPMLVEAIKEQQTIINRLEERLNSLENKGEK